MLKIRRPLGRLIFNMGIAIPGKTVFLIETAPRMIQPHSGACPWVSVSLFKQLKRSAFFRCVGSHFEIAMVGSSDFHVWKTLPDSPRVFGRLCTGVRKVHNDFLNVRLLGFLWCLSKWTLVESEEFVLFDGVRYRVVSIKAWCQIVFILFLADPFYVLDCFYTLFAKHFFSVNAV